MSSFTSSGAAALLFIFEQPTLLLLLLATPYAFCLQDHNDFILCLDTHSHSQYPTSQVTYTRLNSSFSSVLQAYARNARFDQPHILKPLFIVAPEHVSSIQATIKCCKNHGLEMRTRGGGHDMEGLSYVSRVPFVILDMFKFRSIDVDIKNKSMWLQAGATLGEVYHSIAQKSHVYAFPGGVCLTVGTTGHFSGGGYGNLARMYGLSSDNVMDAIIVDVQGRVLNRKTMGEDLFWAIRGGGAASFGVVLAWKVRLFRVPPVVTVFRVERSLQEGTSHTLYRWQEVAPNLPKNLYLRFRAAVIKDCDRCSSNKLQISFIAMFLGRAKQLVHLLAKRFPELKLAKEDCVEMPWVDSVLFWANFPNGTSRDVLISRHYKRVARKVKSDYVKKPIPKAGLDAMWAELLKMDGLVMEWNPYGGRMSEISETEIAFPYRRKNLFKIEYDFIWYKDVAKEKHHIRAARRLYDFMAPYVSKFPRQAFFNYRDLDIGTDTGGTSVAKTHSSFGIKYFGKNFHRLVKVKIEVDPLNFFRNEQSIPPFLSQ